VKGGDTVRLAGASGEFAARVHVCEKVMDGVVAAPLGLGHTAWDEYVKGKGDNVHKLLAVAEEPETGRTVWTGSRVNIAVS
jgi:anaerobic selenocysteine-containing dehydrogenase